jgi:hypothetical protein
MWNGEHSNLASIVRDAFQRGIGKRSLRHYEVRKRGWKCLTLSALALKEGMSGGELFSGIYAKADQPLIVLCNDNSS